MRAIVAVLAAAATLAAAPSAAAGPGTFASSDPLLNRIWTASVRTATEMVAAGPLVTDTIGRPCAIDLPVVILDGAQRDRCPYIGDQAVTGKTLLLSDLSHGPAIRDLIRWFALNQHADGSIPASPYAGGSLVLFDYNGYWIESLYDYVLATGDRAFAIEVWDALVRLVDEWYPARVGPRQLLVNDLGPSDYAYIRRTGDTVAYFNAGYVRSLRMAADLATWAGFPERAAAWRARALPVAAAFSAAFWDPSAGAFLDSVDGPRAHPQDANALAVVAGLATRQQTLATLDYMSRWLWRPYGSAMVDNDAWDAPGWGSQASQRVYPFVGYFELLARFTAGLDASALDLIRREWGYMLANGPRSTMWETIGPSGGPPVDPNLPSYNHGWSSGAAPALTRYVLGVRPTAPGFTGFVVWPRLAGLSSARGVVPTPRGPIRVDWSRKGKRVTLKVTAPVAGTITLPAVGKTTLDGKKVATQRLRTTLKVRPGTHVLVVLQR